MRALIRSLCVALLANAVSLAPAPLVRAAIPDTTADHVLGQPDFSSTAANSGGPSASTLQEPLGVAVDPGSGRLYAADHSNNRVLSWPNTHALMNGEAADLVIGQPSFTTTNANHGGLGPASLSRPYAVALDAQGDLYVADTMNHRVLEYDAPLANHAAADRVFGQPDFTHNAPNNGGLNPTAHSLDGPTGVAVDALGNLYVADYLNNRVLAYNDPPANDTTADRVLGQKNFTSDAASVSATTLTGPQGVTLDGQGNLYVADTFNNRVLEYDAPLATHAAAARVIGQPDFNSSTINSGSLSAKSLFSPEGVALDAHGNLYVADFNNNRVLEYNAPLATHAAADRVFGQPDFTHRIANNGGVNARSLSVPFGVALDAQGDLFVVDTGNNRLLEYDQPLPLLRIFLPLVMR